MKKKIAMPEEEQKKCHAIIHSAAAAAAAAAIIPIPFADAVPITAIQVGMIISLGKVFEININDTVAKAIASCTIAQNLGKNIAKQLLKFTPLSIFINPGVAAAMTEAMGWKIADDFYKVSIGEEPDNFLDKIPEFAPLFAGLKKASKTKIKK